MREWGWRELRLHEKKQYKPAGSDSGLLTWLGVKTERGMGREELSKTAGPRGEGKLMGLWS